MMSPDKQVEIAKLAMDAAFGYTKAAINAAFEATSRTLAVCHEVAHATLPQPPAKEETWEWSGAPRRPHSTLLAPDRRPAPETADPFAVWANLVQAGQKAWLGPGAPSPFAWWMWTPQSAVPASWPLAYGMISSGVPGSVAWPMAEANVALFDAARKTAEAAGPAVPSYRSDNGFAVAQVWPQPQLLKVLFAASPAAVAVWPWLDRAA